MNLLHFSEEELRQAAEISESPLETVTRHMGESALSHRADLHAAGATLGNVLAELAEVRRQIETTAEETDDRQQEEKPPPRGSRWKKLLSTATTQISSIGTKIASTTKMTTLRRKESKLLESAGWLFSQSIGDGLLEVPAPIKALSERVLLLTTEIPVVEAEQSSHSSADLKNVLGGTVGFLKTAAGKAKKLISSESLKTELRTLQARRTETYIAIGRQAVKMKAIEDILPDFPVQQVRLMAQEIVRLKKQLGGDEVPAGVESDEEQPEFFSKISRMTGSFISVERLKAEIHKREQEVFTILAENGEAIYRLFEKGELADERLRRKCKPLKAINYSIRQKELEVKRIMEEVSGDDLATMLHKRMSSEDAAELDQQIMERYGRHLTIMFTDLKDFTRKSATLDMVEMMEMMQEHDDLIIPVIEELLGRIIKKIGDAVMAVFENPVNAVKAAVAVQRKLRSRNRDITDPSRKIQVRIGINCGMVLEKEGDVYGDPVNMASRVEGLAKEEQIFITREVFDFLDEDELPCTALPPQKVKGKDEPIPIYEVKY